MPCDYNLLTHKGIQSLSPYIPGKSTESLAKEQGLTDIIKLASNENPLGCSPHALNALKMMTGHQVSTYLISSDHPIKQKIASRLGVDSDRMTLVNGSDVLIPLIQTCFALHNDKHILTHDHAFISYRIFASSLGIPVVTTPIFSNGSVDIDAIISACTKKTAAIFMASPNNPTGVLVPQTEVERLLNNIPTSTILVLDEAYYEFVDKDKQTNTAYLLATYPNLIITRTFSKAYGLAGLRIGYAVANASISSILNRVLPPFSVSVTSVMAASAALDDQAFIKKTIYNNRLGLKQIHQGLDELGLSYLPTSTNFITFNCNTDALPIYEKLLQKGIIVRPLHPYHMNNYLRVTVGTQMQNDRFIKELKELHHEQPFK
jgi:histidinol-phosphate aminotransferase